MRAPASPLDASAPWLELSSRHFLVDTNASSERARAMVADLEVSFAFLQQVAFPHRPPLEMKVRVVAFDGIENLASLGHPDVAGWSSDAVDGFESRQSIVVAYGSDESSQTLMHELVHRFVAFYLPSAPVWLHEGLAQYYSTMRLDGGRVVFGEPLEDRAFTADSWKLLVIDKHLALGIPRSAVPRAGRLRAMSSKEFYAGSSDTVTANYAGAWALVQTLASEPDGHVRLQQYLDELYRADVDEPRAWQKHWADLDDVQLQTRLEAFMRAHAVDVLRVPPPSVSATSPDERRMSASEVQTLWAELQLGRGEELDRDLERALEADPGNAEAYLQRSFRLQAKGASLAQLERDVNQAYRLAPDNPRYLLAKARLEHRHAGQGSASNPAPEIWATKLAGKATGAPEFAFLGYEALRRHRLARAQHYATKALAADVSAQYCYVLAARVAAARLDYRFAVVALRTALNLRREGRPAPELQQELEAYDVLARAGASGPSKQPQAETATSP